MPDLEAIIAAQVEKAEASGDVPDDPSAHIDEGESEVEEVVDGEEAPVAGDKPKETPADKDKGEDKPKPDEELDFDKIPAQDQRKRENRIPHSQVKRIVATAEKRLAALVLGKDPDTGKPLSDQVKAYIAQLPELQGKVRQYEEEVTPMRTLGQIMATDSQKFLQILATAYPQLYGELVKKPEPGAFKPDLASKPQPDYKLPDGSMTYSLEGYEKLTEWNNAQVFARVREEAKAAVAESTKPLTDSIAAQKQISAANQRIVEQMSIARNWDGFKENEAEIIAAMNEATDAKQRLPIELAYAQVIAKKSKEREAALVADREKMRADLLKEIKAAPVSTAVSGKGDGTKPIEGEELSEADGGDDAVTRAIKRAIAKKSK